MIWGLEATSEWLQRLSPLTRLSWAPRRQLVRRYVVISVLSVLVAVGLWLATDPANQKCSHLSCNVNTNLVAAIVVAIGAYLLFIARTRVPSLHWYLREVRTRPERVVWGGAHGPTLADTEQRPELCRAVAEQLRVDGEHVPLVVGEIGAGKTTFIAALAAYLAERGAVPVYVSLRNERFPFDLPALARRSFRRQVNHLLISDTAGDRLWRQIWRQRLVVVLADGLDEALAGGEVVDASELATGIIRPQKDPPAGIVVTSRLESVGARSGYAVSPLEPLDRKKSAELVAKRAAARAKLASNRSDRRLETSANELEKAALRTVDVLDIRVTPFYLQMVTTLIDLERATDILTSLSDGRQANSRAAQDRARCSLLDCYRDAIIDGRDSGLTKLQAAKRIDELAKLAYQMVVEERFTFGCSDGALTETMSNLAPGDHSEPLCAPSDVIADARRLGLIAGGTAAQNRVRFLHPILQAYLASRVLHVDEDGVPRWRKLLETKAPTDEVLEALRLFAARREQQSTLGDEQCVASEVCEGLLNSARAEIRGNGDGSSERAVRLVAAAVRVAASDNGPNSATQVFVQLRKSSRLRKVWDSDSPRDPSRAIEDRAYRIETIKALADLCQTTADKRRATRGYKLLWELGRAQTYAVAWQVVEAFASSEAAGFTAIQNNVTQLIRHGLATAPESLDKEDLIPRLSTLAKFLPAVVVTLRAETDPVFKVARDALRDLIALVRKMTAEDLGIGTEASLAQGFKYAASLGDASALDDQLFELLGDQSHDPPLPAAKFWYSRVNALQALARRGIALACDDGDRRAVERIKTKIQEHASSDPHKFALHAAKLCIRAVEVASKSRRREAEPRRREAESYIWDDEAVEVSRSGAELAPEANRLLADIVLELNMNEQNRIGGVRMESLDGVLRPMEDFDRVGISPDVPLCLAHDPDRDRVLALKNEVACTCDLRLCPYDPSAPHGHAYRDLSRAFCAHQQRLASRYRPGPLEFLHFRVPRRCPIPWQPDLTVEKLAAFWAEMEKRASY